jgi:serralysin
MPQQSSPRICFDRVVPSNYQLAGATTHRIAISNYIAAVRQKTARLAAAPPANATLFQHVNSIPKLGTLSVSDPVAVARMAVIDLKKWDNGRTLRCRFLDGDDFQQGKVKDKANIWRDYANIALSFVTDPDAELRVSFQADAGSWSGVGTDCLNTDYFPQYQPTMNFGWLRDDTEDVEYERVVVHEFGHALGCIHEHQSPTENLQWNVDAVYAAFSGPPNYWSKDDIDHNILQKYSPDGISATRFDNDSIMLYQFDGSLFIDGQGTPLNTHLSDQDKQMIGQMYPKQAADARSAGSPA